VKHMVCCIFCRTEVSAQGLNGHMRAMHQRGADQRAVGRRPVVGSGYGYIRCPS
jgi:hypothetical protein